MLRNIVGALAGIAVAFLTVLLIEWIGNTVFPMPAGVDVNDAAAMSNYVSSMPVGALLLVLAGYIIATFDGTFVAQWIGQAKPYIFALVVGVPMLVATIGTLVMIQHPMWFNIAAVAGIVVAAWSATVAVPSTNTTKLGIR